MTATWTFDATRLQGFFCSSTTSSTWLSILSRWAVNTYINAANAKISRYIWLIRGSLIDIDKSTEFVLFCCVVFQVKQVFPLGFYSLLVIPFALAAMNVFWFWKIARGMIKTLSKASHSRWSVVLSFMMAMQFNAATQTLDSLFSYAIRWMSVVSDHVINI